MKTMLKGRCTLLTAAAIAAVSLLGLSAYAGPGSGTHGGKMVLCFTDETGQPDYSASSKYFRWVPDETEGDTHFKGWMFRDDARALAKGHFTATLLELYGLKDADVLHKDWEQKSSMSDALQAMHDSLRGVPKFYRLVEGTRFKLPMLGEESGTSLPVDSSLMPIDDAVVDTSLGHEATACVPAQAALRDDHVSPPRLQYDSLIWDAPTTTNAQRAALQFHEELYYLGAKYFGHQDSLKTQMVVAYLARGKVDLNWRGSTCDLTPQWDDGEKNACGAENALQAQLSGTDFEPETDGQRPDVFGYYPTLGTLTGLRDAAEQEVLALHGALSTIGAYCDSVGHFRDYRKAKALVDVGGLSAVRGAQASLWEKGQGILPAIASLEGTSKLEGPSKKIDEQIQNQNKAFPSAVAYSEDNKDPEVLLVKLTEQLVSLGSSLTKAMASAPIDFNKTSGYEAYCAARQDAEDKLGKINDGLEGLNFMWDKTLRRAPLPGEQDATIARSSTIYGD